MADRSILLKPETVNLQFFHVRPQLSKYYISVPFSINTNYRLLISLKKKTIRSLHLPRNHTAQSFSMDAFYALALFESFHFPKSTILFVDKSTQVKMGFITENDSFCKIFSQCKSFQNPISKSLLPFMISWHKSLCELNFGRVHMEIFMQNSMQ